MKRILGYLIVCFAFLPMASQQLYPVKDYLGQVLREHPMAQQAALQEQMADAQEMNARGFFDPELKASWNQKEFKDTDYYRVGKVELNIPTPIGLDIVANYENNDGVYLNRQLTVPDNGLWSVGLEANLLQGLLIDERRTAQSKAKVFRSLSENEQNRLINELLLLSSLAYVDWNTYYEIEKIIDESLVLADEYYESTKTLFVQGDKPAIDTLEAFLIKQDRLNRFQENQIYLIEAQQNMEIFLWGDQAMRSLVGLSPDRPVDEDEMQASEWGQRNWVQSHPDLVKNELKIQDLTLDKRLKQEKLKPKLNISYNPLINTGANAFDTDFSLSNYKWGLDFSFPLFLRKERSEVEFAELKIREVELELQNKQNVLVNKVEAIEQKIEMLEQQIELQKENVINYRRLLEGERTKFQYGESSVFLLNSREQKYLDARIKLVITEMKLQNAYLIYLYTSNQIQDWSGSL